MCVKIENGERILKTITAGSKHEAERLAQEFSDGCWKKTHILTVGQAIDGCIKLKRNVLSPSTIHGYEVIRNHRLQYLMDCDVEEADTILVQQAINEDAVRLSWKSIHEAVQLMQTALKMHGHRPDLNVSLPPRKPNLKELPTAEQIKQKCCLHTKSHTSRK